LLGAPAAGLERSSPEIGSTGPSSAADLTFSATACRSGPVQPRTVTVQE